MATPSVQAVNEIERLLRDKCNSTNTDFYPYSAGYLLAVLKNIGDIYPETIQYFNKEIQRLGG